MYKKTLQLILLIVIMMFTGSFVSAQEENVEKKVEKKVKIIMIDEEGNKTEKDTVLAGNASFHMTTKDTTGKHHGYFVVKSDDGSKSELEKNVYVMSKSDGNTFTITDSDSMVWVDDMHNMVWVEGESHDISSSKMVVKVGKDEGNKTMIFISEPGEKGKSYYVRTEDGVIVQEDIKSGIHTEMPAEGESVIIVRTHGSEEIMKIKGDAVITIKDGTVKVENSSNKGKEVVKEEEVKTKKKNNK